MCVLTFNSEHNKFEMIIRFPPSGDGGIDCEYTNLEFKEKESS